MLEVLVNNLDDGRISKFHRQIYDWLKEIYPSFKIELEKLIPKTNQRIDLYIYQLDLAIECDGTFHDTPDFFFVKTQEQWKDIIERDKLKVNTLNEYGLDLLRIPYNHKLKNSKDLEKLIDYFYKEKNINNEFDSSLFDSKFELNKKENMKKYNDKSKEVLNNYKSSQEFVDTKDEYNKKSREFNKQRRKEQYKKLKEKTKYNND